MFITWEITGYSHGGPAYSGILLCDEKEMTYREVLSME